MTVEEWAERVVDADYKRVALTQVGPVLVSTVWIGTNTSLFGPPLIFETMGMPACKLYARYSSLDAAKAGHDEIVTRLVAEQGGAN